MRITPPGKPSVVKAALGAPLVTPIVSLLLTAYVPGVPHVDPMDLLVFFPIVFVWSLAYGYLGMFLICLPAVATLRRFGRLNALSLCLATTLLGGSAWTLLAMTSNQWEASRLIGTFVIGSGCSLVVVVFFCILAEIGVEPSREA